MLTPKSAQMLDRLFGEKHVFNTILSQRLAGYLDPDGSSDRLQDHRKLARRSRLQREFWAAHVSLTFSSIILSSSEIFQLQNKFWE